MKKSNKEMLIEVLVTVGAKKVGDVYEVTKKAYDSFLDDSEGMGLNFSICKNKKDDSLKGLYDVNKKNRYAIIKIVPKKSKKTKVDGPIVHKEVSNCYVIKYSIDGEKAIVNDEISTCKEIKEFIKQLKKEKPSYLCIFKMGPNYQNDSKDIIPTRKSAWI